MFVTLALWVSVRNLRAKLGGTGSEVEMRRLKLCHFLQTFKYVSRLLEISISSSTNGRLCKFTRGLHETRLNEVLLKF